jgi:hypothetical protein
VENKYGEEKTGIIFPSNLDIDLPPEDTEIGQSVSVHHVSFEAAPESGAVSVLRHLSASRVS